MGEQALGEFLVSQGLLRKDGLKRALDAQTALECRLGSVLLDLGLMPENVLLKALGRYNSARTVSARDLNNVPPEIIEKVPARFALRHQVVPFAMSGKTMSVATMDPRDLLVEDELGQLTGCMISSFVAHEVRLHQALSRYYGMQLSVQASSLLKRLPYTDEADQKLDPVSAGHAAGASTDVLTDVVEKKSAKPAPDHRSGLARRRDPDSTMIVELSQDELADFPSLALDDTDAGQGAKTAAPEPTPPDSIEVVERPVSKPPPPAPAGNETVVAPPPVPGAARRIDERVVRQIGTTPDPPTAAQPPAKAPSLSPVIKVVPPMGTEETDDLATMMIEALPAARRAEQATPAPPPAAGDDTHPHEEADGDPNASTGPLDPVESRLAAAAAALQAAEMREDIADAVMEFCRPYLKRRLLLAVRDNTVIGWRGEGEQVDPMWVKSMAIRLDEPSVFVSLTMGKEYWRGSLPPTVANQELLLGLGGERPAECLILPLVIRSKPIGFLYGDNISDNLGDVPWIPLRRLTAKAGLAFEISILRNKVRTL